MPKKHKKGHKKKSKKKEKIPWYMMEEMMKEEEEKKMKAREANEAKEKLEEEEKWFNSLPEDEQEKILVQRAADAQRKKWNEITRQKADEEAKELQKQMEREEIMKRRGEEREERKKLAQEGRLEITGVLLRKCNTCNLVVYANEQIEVSKDVFHKIGCFKCFYCSTPLKLWNYKKLETKYYCKAHYEQFFQKIVGKNLQLLNQQKGAEINRKWAETKAEEARIAAEEKKKKEEEVERAKGEKDRAKREAIQRKNLKREAMENARKIALLMGEPDPYPNGIPEEADEPEEADAAGGSESEGSGSGSGSGSESESEEESQDDQHKTSEQLELENTLMLAQAGSSQVLDKITSGSMNVNGSNSEGETLLHMACMSANKDLVQTLIEKGANLDKKTKSMATALHLVCNNDATIGDKDKETNELEVVKLLLEKSADSINESDLDFNTPLILASSKGKVEVVRALIKAGARVRPKNNLGATCLHAAADSGQVEVAKQLINVEAMDVNMQDEQGYTPLHLAVMGNHTKMVTLLLALGSKYDIKDKAHQRTAEDEINSSSDEIKKIFEGFKPRSMAAASAQPIKSPTPERKIEKTREVEAPKSPKPMGTISRLFGKKDKTSTSSLSNVMRDKDNKDKEEKKSSASIFSSSRRKEEEERRKEEELRKRQEEDKLIAEDRRREQERRRQEEDRQREEDRAKDEKRRVKEDKRRRKEEEDRRKEEERRVAEEKRLEEEKKLEEERRAAEEIRLEEERKKKEEDRKKAAQIMAKIKTVDGPTFLADKSTEKPKSPAPTSIGKIQAPSFVKEEPEEIAQRSPRQVGKIKPPSLWDGNNNNNETEPGPSPRSVTAIPGKIKAPDFLSSLTKSDEGVTKNDSLTTPGRIKTPTFLQNSQDSNHTTTPSNNNAPQSIGRIKQPAFLAGNNNLDVPKPAAAKGVGKLAKPAFLQKAEEKAVAPIKSSGKSAFGKKKVVEEDDEDEEGYEYEEEEDGEYEYEYEYEEE